MKKAALTVSLLMIAALSLNAQTVTTTTVLSQSNRGPGTFTSASARLPDPMIASSVKFTFTLGEADRTDPNLRFRAALEVYDESVIPAVWKEFASKYHEGVQYDKAGLPTDPFIYTNMSGYAGKLVRGILDLPERRRIGVTATYTTN